MSEEPTMQTDGQPEGQATEQSPAPEIRALDVLHYAIGMFNDVAWMKLGIRTNPATGETQADLPDAKLAIDALNALVQLTEGRLDPHEVRDMKNLVASLQMNYVQRMNG
jgi:hypothetical protein